MTGNNKLAISGSRRFHQAIKTLHPNASRRDINILREQFLGTTSDYMIKGYQPAVTKRNTDGSMDMIILSFEDLKGKEGKVK